MAKLPSVTNEVIDGGLGFTPGLAREPWAAIGAASLTPGLHAIGNPAQMVSAVRALGTPRDVRDQLGRGDLPELISSALAIAEGQCFAVSVPGTRAAGTLTGATANTGAGTITLGYAGALAGANAEYSGSLVIVEEGGLGVAEYQLVIDGVMDQIRTVPATPGTYAIPGTDMVLTFVAATPDIFEVGDNWTLAAPAPTASQAEVLAAIEELVCSEHRFRWISVAGVSTSTLWTALASRADSLAIAANPRYLHFKVQQRRNAAGEDAAAWVDVLTGTGRGNTSSTRVQCWGAWIDETDPFGVTEDRGMIGRASGLSARRRAHETIDAVKRRAIPGANGIVPVGLTDAQILSLDQAGYATVRRYGGLRGVYVTHGRMLAPSTSDFQFEERRRVMDLACERVHDRQRDEYLNSEIDLDAAGLDMFLRVSSGPLQLMQDLGFITSFQVRLNSSVEEILATDTIRTRISIQPLGKASQIENEISYYRGVPQTEEEA